ncbi:permease [Streptococcus suis]|nr:permease [Streptococcus suis]
MLGNFQLPLSVSQTGTIFLSIIIEALPFVLIGAILSGFIEVFVTPDIVHKYLPKNKILAVLFGSLIGVVFPSCECGIVPIVHRMLEKKIPSYTAIPFLVTAPIINPIVLFATFTAFGNSLTIALYRAFGAILTSFILGIILVFFVKEPIAKRTKDICHHKNVSPKTTWQKIGASFIHAVDEFFETGPYLVAGCLFASIVQVYVPTTFLRTIGHQPVTAILLMMLLAFLLSLCSEADAFIAASLLSSFGIAPIMAFLVIGPMIDVKNLMMMQSYFKGKYILSFIVTIVIIILSYSLIIGGMI